MRRELMQTATGGIKEITPEEVYARAVQAGHIPRAVASRSVERATGQRPKITPPAPQKDADELVLVARAVVASACRGFGIREPDVKFFDAEWPPTVNLAPYQRADRMRGVFVPNAPGAGTIWILRGESLFEVASIAAHECVHAFQVHREGAGPVSRSVYYLRELRATNRQADFLRHLDVNYGIIDVALCVPRLLAWAQQTLAGAKMPAEWEPTDWAD